MEPLTPVVSDVEAPETLDFYQALKQVAEGKRITRLSWNNDDYGYMQDGYLCIHTKNALHIWKVSDGDMEGDDWVVLSTLN